MPGAFFGPCFNAMGACQVILRHTNSYSGAFRNQCLEVARAVQTAYGGDYSKSVEYLRGLAANKFYNEAVLQPLPWLSQQEQTPGVGTPVYRLHPTVLAGLAPSVALRAVFGGARNQ